MIKYLLIFPPFIIISINSDVKMDNQAKQEPIFMFGKTEPIKITEEYLIELEVISFFLMYVKMNMQFILKDKKGIIMKYFKNEIIEHSDVPKNTIFVFGDNKKSHLGYFNEVGDCFGFVNDKTTKLQKNAVNILKVTNFSIGEHKEAKETYDKEFLTNLKNGIMSKRPQYTAALLTQKSGEKLVETLKDKIPEGWDINCHHMTISLGFPPAEVKELLGQSVELNITEYGIDEELQVMAVKVETDLYSKNDLKHITVALNKEEGAKAVDSNKITNFKPLEKNIKLEANVDVVLKNKTCKFGAQIFKPNSERKSPRP